MKITEVVAGIYGYVVTLRAYEGKFPAALKTILFASGIAHARAVAVALYGEGNVVAVNPINERKISEVSQSAATLCQSPRIVPTQYTRSLTRRALVDQMKRNVLHVKPTADDLRAAQEEFEAEQKRVNREYQDALEDRYKWAQIRKRRLKKSGDFSKARVRS